MVCIVVVNYACTMSNLQCRGVTLNPLISQSLNSPASLGKSVIEDHICVITFYCLDQLFEDT